MIDEWLHDRPLAATLDCVGLALGDSDIGLHKIGMKQRVGICFQHCKHPLVVMSEALG